MTAGEMGDGEGTHGEGWRAASAAWHDSLQRLSQQRHGIMPTGPANMPAQTCCPCSSEQPAALSAEGPQAGTPAGTAQQPHTYCACPQASAPASLASLWCSGRSRGLSMWPGALGKRRGACSMQLHSVQLCSCAAAAGRHSWPVGKDGQPLQALLNATAHLTASSSATQQQHQQQAAFATSAHRQHVAYHSCVMQSSQSTSSQGAAWRRPASHLLHWATPGTRSAAAAAAPAAASPTPPAGCRPASLHTPPPACRWCSAAASAGAGRAGSPAAAAAGRHLQGSVRAGAGDQLVLKHRQGFSWCASSLGLGL